MDRPGFEKTGSAMALGLMQFFFTPFPLISPLAGMMVDRP
jgi:hypothetical protein